MLGVPFGFPDEFYRGISLLSGEFVKMISDLSCDRNCSKQTSS